MAMQNGFDQFLANRPTNAGAVWVALDPSRADAILTDRLDEEFWKWLNARFPLVSQTSPLTADDLRLNGMSEPAGAIRGTVFLDPKARLALWSSYDEAKKESPDQMVTSLEKR